MAEFRTKYFDRVTYDENSVVFFPAGLPGFERQRRFLFIEQPVNKPLVFIQSLSRPGLCFLALPILMIDAGFRLNIAPDDLRLLALPENGQPAIGREVACLAIVSIAKNQSPTANLLSPVVVNLANRRAVQAIQIDSGYSHRHVLTGEGGLAGEEKLTGEGEAVCS